MKLYDILERSAQVAVEEQRDDGSLPSGHNGPYHDSETPVRNTSHWLITFLKVYEITGDETYRKAALQASDYLRSPEARPHGVTFHHREVENKNSCNSLIGQAWSIEALAMAAMKSTHKASESVRIAEDVFLLHPFDWELALWKQVEIDGTVLPFDATFNHQLWFAAAGALLTQFTTVSPKIDERVTRFLDELNNTIQIYPDGLIKHSLDPDPSVDKYLHMILHDRYARLFVMAVVRRFSLVDNRIVRTVLNKPYIPIRRAPLTGKEIRRKAMGYHSFNLYALALLYKRYPEHPFWESETFRKIWEYARSDAYREGLDGNSYGYPYNPPGFEIPFALEVFGDDSKTESQEWWLSSQLQRCYDPQTHQLSRNTEDPVTLTARLYQATRLPNIDVDIEGSSSLESSL